MISFPRKPFRSAGLWIGSMVEVCRLHEQHGVDDHARSLRHLAKAVRQSAIDRIQLEESWAGLLPSSPLSSCGTPASHTNRKGFLTGKANPASIRQSAATLACSWQAGNSRSTARVKPSSPCRRAKPGRLHGHAAPIAAMPNLRRFHSL